MVIYGLWSDGAVIQQNRTIEIRGTSFCNATVVSCLKTMFPVNEICNISTFADKNGFFEIKIPPIKASGVAYSL